MEYGMIIWCALIFGLIISAITRQCVLKHIKGYEHLIENLQKELYHSRNVASDKNAVIEAKDGLIEELSNKTKEAQHRADTLAYNYNELDDKFRTTLNQKVSSEVKIGRIGEQFFCFMDEYPHNPNDFRFLGSPIDGLQFDFENDQIFFVEIKTGKSRLSDRQKKCRDIIRKGNIRFMEFRVGENGVEIKYDDKEEPQV